MEMPLPADMEERREMLKYQIHSIPKEKPDGPCERMYHFIVGKCGGGKYCDQCGIKLEPAESYIREPQHPEG